tara:strand:+ start:629 stop:1897 length:1269 start_codon:yes stop_codon:yes gene_type:complete
MEKLRKLFTVKNEEKNDQIDPVEQTDFSNNVRITYFESGFAASKKASGGAINLVTCLSNVYNSFEDQCRNQKIEQEKLKRPYIDETGTQKSELKKLDTLKEINEEKIANFENEIDVCKKDLINVKINPDEYGLDIENKPKANFYIGLFLLIPITIYLLVFYISATYSAFFKVFNDDSLSAAIFDAESLSNAWSHGALEAILIFTIPFVFMGLGYLIHMMQKQKSNGSYLKLFGLYTITFLFDGLLAYVIEKKIYEFNKTPSSPEFNFSIAIRESEFWMIIFAGFVVYLIWGLVFDFIMKEYESLDKINIFIAAKKREILNLLDKKHKINEDLVSIKTKISEIQGKIAELTSKIQGFIFPVKTYLHYHHQYAEGWNTAISTELALPRKQHDELLLECKNVCEEHLQRLNLDEAVEQNIIYAKN